MQYVACKHHPLHACRACLEYAERSPDTLARAKSRQRLLDLATVASNPFNRIEDREAELRHTLRTR